MISTLYMPMVISAAGDFKAIHAYGPAGSSKAQRPVKAQLLMQVLSFSLQSLSLSSFCSSKERARQCQGSQRSGDGCGYPRNQPNGEGSHICGKFMHLGRDQHHGIAHGICKPGLRIDGKHNRHYGCKAHAHSCHCVME